MRDVRDEIMAELTKVAANAIAEGRDGLRAIQAACPGVPMEVAVQAELRATDAQTEAWWRSVERTIDGELVQRAIAAVDAGGTR